MVVHACVQVKCVRIFNSLSRESQGFGCSRLVWTRPFKAERTREEERFGHVKTKCRLYWPLVVFVLFTPLVLLVALLVMFMAALLYRVSWCQNPPLFGVWVVGRESGTLILYSGLFCGVLWFKVCMVDTFLD